MKSQRQYLLEEINKVKEEQKKAEASPKSQFGVQVPSGSVLARRPEPSVLPTFRTLQYPDVEEESLDEVISRSKRSPGYRNSSSTN